MSKIYLKLTKLTGLSLIEILITISIVLILSTASIYSYKDYKMTAMYNSLLATIQQNQLIITEFYAKNKVCPKNNFIDINTTANSSSLWTSISNTGCAISIYGPARNNPSTNVLILTFDKEITDLGYLVYSCSKVGADYEKDVKNYISLCAQATI